MGLATTDVLRIESERWRAAQDFELRFAQGTVNAGDDYNLWWYAAFNRYEILAGKRFPHVIEVGCGPHTNIRLMIPRIRFEHLWLEDPLIHDYVKMKSYLCRTKAWICAYASMCWIMCKMQSSVSDRCGGY